MSNVQNFEDILSLGKFNEDRIDNWLKKNNPDIKIEIVGPVIQSLGIDRIITNPEGIRFSAEYKSDNRIASTGNIFLELIRYKQTNTKGWAYTSIANYIYILSPKDGKLFIIDAALMKCKLFDTSDGWLKTCKQVNNQTKVQSGTTYDAVGLLVPVHDFEVMCDDVTTI